jgi:hypothetical protein
MDVEVHGNGASAGQRFDGGAQSSLRQDRRMESPRDLLHLRRNPGHSCHQPSDLLLERLQFVRHTRFRGPQLKAQRDQRLLGAVVQVAFQTAARIIGGRDDPDPSGPIEWASGYSEICAARADRFGTRFQLENTGGTCMTMVARLEARHRATHYRLRRHPVPSRVAS